MSLHTCWCASLGVFKEFMVTPRLITDSSLRPLRSQLLDKKQDNESLCTPSWIPLAPRKPHANMLPLLFPVLLPLQPSTTPLATAALADNAMPSLLNSTLLFPADPSRSSSSSSHPPPWNPNQVVLQRCSNPSKKIFCDHRDPHATKPPNRMKCEHGLRTMQIPEAHYFKIKNPSLYITWACLVFVIEDGTGDECDIWSNQACDGCYVMLIITHERPILRFGILRFY